MFTVRNLTKDEKIEILEAKLANKITIIDDMTKENRRLQDRNELLEDKNNKLEVEIANKDDSHNIVSEIKRNLIEIADKIGLKDYRYLNSSPIFAIIKGLEIELNNYKKIFGPIYLKINKK